jgi:hypothetical protein
MVPCPNGRRPTAGSPPLVTSMGWPPNATRGKGKDRVHRRRLRPPVGEAGRVRKSSSGWSEQPGQGHRGSATRLKAERRLVPGADAPAAHLGEGARLRGSGETSEAAVQARPGPDLAVAAREETTRGHERRFERRTCASSVRTGSSPDPPSSGDTPERWAKALVLVVPTFFGVGRANWLRRLNPAPPIPPPTSWRRVIKHRGHRSEVTASHPNPL